MKELLILMAKGLVEDPEAVVVTEDEPTEDGTVVLHLKVAADDMGRVIGKQGRIARSIRTVLKAYATKNKEKASLDIV